MDFDTMSDLEWCRSLRALDRQYNTDPRSPLHHDQRCGLHGRITR